MKNLIKKIISYLFIIITLVGLFGVENKTYAADTVIEGTCTVKTTPKPTPSNPSPSTTTVKMQSTSDQCGLMAERQTTGQTVTTTWVADGGKTADKNIQTSANLEQQIEDGCWSVVVSSAEGCVRWMVYKLMFAIPSGLLWLSGYVFNTFINLTIQSDLYKGTFISSAWAVIRDISNIFFILILIYAAVKMILGMSGHETKSTIAGVVIMAILINFSLFFTKVVIDSSNVIALVFYNKLDTTTKDGKPRPFNSITGKGDKDLSGAFYSNFNVLKLLNGDFIQKFRSQKVQDADGKEVISDSGELPFFATTTIIIIAGIIMMFASYVFFSSGIYFVGRIVELWILMIASPFAFMSFAVPKFSHIENIGWSKWLEKLISTSFSAPIFMFFLYVIFLLLKANPFSGFIPEGSGVINTLISTLLPTMLILGLLMKAKSMAKESGGKFGEMAMAAAKMIAVTVAGAVVGGTAAAARFTVGRNAAAASRAAFQYDREVEAFAKTGQRVPYPVPPPKNYEYGAKINAAQEKVSHIEHAAHEWSDIKKGAGVENISDENLSAPKIQEMLEAFLKKNLGSIKAEVREGVDSKGKVVETEAKDKNGNALLDANNNAIIAAGEDDFKRKRRGKLEQYILANNDPSEVQNGVLTRKGTQRINEQLTAEFNEILKSRAAQIAVERFDKIKSGATEKATLGEKIYSRAPGSSYDLRRLADVVTKNSTLGTKLTLGLTAAVAMGIRSGFKNAGLNLGKSQGNIYKDIGEVVSEALKHAKISVPSSGGDHGHGGGDAHSSSAHGGGH